jgi:hypothetical protein
LASVKELSLYARSLSKKENPYQFVAGISIFSLEAVQDAGGGSGKPGEELSVC